MARKFFICFIAAIALLQVSFAVPVSKEDSSSEEKDEGNLVLLRFALQEFGQVAKGTLVQGIDLLKAVVKDLQENEKKTASDDEEIEKLNKFIENAEKVKITDEDMDLKGILETFVSLSSLLDSYDDVVPESSNKLVNELIDKNGMKKISADFDEKFAVFAEKFTKEVENYLEKLNDEQKNKETKLIEWFKKFKEEKNIDDKVLVFFEFINVYDSSEEN